MPVSLSCVMLDAVTLKGGSSHDSPLERSRSKMGAPRSPFGVWQFWQVMMVLTRYLPRSTGACANAEVAVSDATSIKTSRICMKASLCAARVAAPIPDYRTAAERPHENCIVCVWGQGPPCGQTKKAARKPPCFELCYRSL